MSKVWVIGLVVIALGVAVAFVVLEPRVAAPQLAGAPGVPCCVICTPVGTIAPTKTATGIATTVATRTPSPGEVRCSQKKGVVIGWVDTSEELHDLLEEIGVSWFYGHVLGNNTHWQAGVEFVPMLRTQLDMFKAAIQYIINVRGYVGGYWLIGNEPDNGSQDNLTYAQAVEVYGKALYYVRSIDPTAKFIMLGLVEPKSPWERQFSAAWVARWGEQPPVAGWALHMYPFPKGAETVGQARDRLLGWLRGWITDHPGKECWITEFGGPWPADTQTIAGTMVRFGNAFEEMEGVTRYSYFWLGSSKPEHDQWDFLSLYVWEGGVPYQTDLQFSYSMLVPTVEPVATCVR